MYTSDPLRRRVIRSAAQSSASPAQCRAARALLRWTQKDLSIRAVVARRTIGDFESGARTLHVRTRFDITRALEDAGVIFDDKGGVQLAGPAVASVDGGSTNAPRATNVSTGNGTHRLMPPLPRQR